GVGLLLCSLHVHYEHAGGMTSYYGALYNALLFNDGYHVEHHANPGIPWNRLPEHRAHGARVSRWPAPLRWMERLGLDGLERLVLHSTGLQRDVVRAHARALRPPVAPPPPAPPLTIRGRGRFPRPAPVL